MNDIICNFTTDALIKNEKLDLGDNLITQSKVYDIYHFGKYSVLEFNFIFDDLNIIKDECILNTVMNNVKSHCSNAFERQKLSAEFIPNYAFIKSDDNWIKADYPGVNFKTKKYENIRKNIVYIDVKKEENILSLYVQSKFIKYLDESKNSHYLFEDVNDSITTNVKKQILTKI